MKRTTFLFRLALVLGVAALGAGVAPWAARWILGGAIVGRRGDPAS